MLLEKRTRSGVGVTCWGKERNSNGRGRGEYIYVGEGMGRGERGKRCARSRKSQVNVGRDVVGDEGRGRGVGGVVYVGG